MNILEEMEKLREHLNILYPIFDRFCENFGFQYANPTSLGRYPRIRIIKHSEKINLAIDLWMELDEHGQRYRFFDPSLPYELGAGASIDFDDGTQHGYRHFRVFAQFSNRPFFEIEETLYNDLVEAYEVIRNWTADEIIIEGKYVKLG